MKTQWKKDRILKEYIFILLKLVTTPKLYFIHIFEICCSK